MYVILKVVWSLILVFQYFNPVQLDSPYAVAEYFTSFDRDVDSYENIEFFESLGSDLDLSMDRNIHYVERNTHWADVLIDDEYFEGFSNVLLEEKIEGQVLHLEWDAPIEQVKGKVVVLPTTDVSLEKADSAYTIDFYGDVDNDQNANRYLRELADAGAIGYIISPHPDASEEIGFIITSSDLPLGGVGVDLETAEVLVDGDTVIIEPYREDIPYVEFVQKGKTEEEIIIMSRLDGSWRGDHVLTSVGSSSILYRLINEMDKVNPDATIRYVFLNGNGDGEVASDDLLDKLKERTPSVKAVLLLEAIGTAESDLFIRTKGMQSYPFLEEEPFTSLDISSLGTSNMDVYYEAGLPIAVLSDSLIALYDAYGERDNMDRLSNEAMEKQVDWLKDWLSTQ